MWQCRHGRSQDSTAHACRSCDAYVYGGRGRWSYEKLETPRGQNESATHEQNTTRLSKGVCGRVCISARMAPHANQDEHHSAPSSLSEYISRLYFFCLPPSLFLHQFVYLCRGMMRACVLGAKQVIPASERIFDGVG